MAQKFATIDGNGAVTGFYSDDLHTTIPASAIPITDTVWAQWAANTVGLRWDGAKLVLYAPPVVSPTPAQVALQIMATGCQVVSTGSSSLSSVFAISPNAQSKIMAVSLYIQVNGTFPRGMTTFSYPDATGTQRLFVSTTQFQDFATKIADYVSELDDVIGSVSSTLPSSPVTII